MDHSQLAYWESRARSWSIAPPLSPSREDIAWYEARAKARADELAGSEMRALLLGATRSIATMSWPQRTSLLVVDWADGMIRRVGSGGGPPKTMLALRADWRELPLATGSMHLAIGDGSSGVMPSTADAKRYFREVSRVLGAGGIYCERCFCRPQRARSVKELFEALFAGRLRDLDLFRLLLAMTLQSSPRDGVSLHRVWRVWNENVPDPSAARERYGWTAQAIGNFEAWRQSDGRYSYLSQDEVALLAEPFFEVLARDLPGYETRDYFPRFVMRARAARPGTTRG